MHYTYATGEVEARLAIKFTQEKEELKLADGTTEIGVRFGTDDKPTHTHPFFSVS